MRTMQMVIGDRCGDGLFVTYHRAESVMNKGFDSAR